jgi:hypothetical protein
MDRLPFNGELACAQENWESVFNSGANVHGERTGELDAADYVYVQGLVRCRELGSSLNPNEQKKSQSLYKAIGRLSACMEMREQTALELVDAISE